VTRRSSYGLDVLDDWRHRSACRSHDGEWWFPDEYRGATAQLIQDRAKRICAGCPVRAECLAWALETDQRFGIWGGLTDSERGDMRGRR
jgi:WhiB family redox-sensing transcriptional regulator